MSWLMPTCRPRRFFFLGALLLLLLCGCQAKTEQIAVTNQAPLPPAFADGEADHGCSYFYFLWGRHAELMLRFEEALEAYQKAVICDPEADFVSEKVPILLLRLERTDEAAHWLRTYLLAHPDKTGMRMLYAKVLLRQKNTVEAMRQYQLISDRHPDDPAILILLAEMYLDAEQPDRARPLLDRVLALDRHSYAGHVLMARLQQMEGRTEEALRHYEKALERNWSSELQMELAELLIKSGQYDEAADLYKDISRRDARNENARIALVHVYLLQNKDEQALAELNRLKSVVDQPQRVDLTIARLYAKQKQYAKAIALAEKILDKENLSEARYFLAVLLVRQEKYGQALQQVRRIERTAPEYAEALLLQARILREQHKTMEARRLLEEQLAAKQVRSAELYILLAALHQEEGRDDLSKKILLQGLEVFPDDENLLYEYGLLLENSGDHSAALAVMQKIIELKPDNAAALNFVGYSWADKKINLDKALEYIQRAIELRPENGYIRDSLGWVYYRLGKLDRAIKELEAAVRLSPDDAAILEHLGDVYLESGRIKEALATYKKAVRLLKDNEQDKKRVMEKIRILDKQGNR